VILPYEISKYIFILVTTVKQWIWNIKLTSYCFLTFFLIIDLSSPILFLPPLLPETSPFSPTRYRKTSWRCPAEASPFYSPRRCPLPFLFPWFFLFDSPPLPEFPFLGKVQEMLLNNIFTSFWVGCAWIRPRPYFSSIGVFSSPFPSSGFLSLPHSKPNAPLGRM